MFFKKIAPHIQESLEREGFKEPTDFQKKFLAKLRSGKDIVGIAPEGSGRSLALLIAALHRLDHAFEQAPRAIIVMETDERVNELAEHFENITRFTDLRIDAVTQKGKTRDQIDWIYEGTDLIIGTAEQLHKLYLQNGINVTQLLLFAVDDADRQLKKRTNLLALERFFIGLPKCQKLICSDVYSARLQKLIDESMPFPEFIEVKE